MIIRGITLGFLYAGTCRKEKYLKKDSLSGVVC